MSLKESLKRWPISRSFDHKQAIAYSESNSQGPYVEPFDVFDHGDFGIDDVEHKVEHNNFRMRGPESDVEALTPTVSP